MANLYDKRYRPVTQAFHWLTAILVLIAFTLGPEGEEHHRHDASSDFGQQLHETIGLLVLALTALRLLWRLADTRPEPPNVARWMGLAAKAVQSTLYILLLAIPLTAIFGIWLEGHSLTLVAGTNIPSPINSSQSAGEFVTEVHTWLGEAILWVAGLHALAALYHHYILKDGVLVSMLPRWFPLSARGNAAGKAHSTEADR